MLEQGMAATPEKEQAYLGIIGSESSRLSRLINLVENSIKFGRGAPERRITITAASRDHQVHIAVSDTGPGIPRRDLARVFDDFYRADSDLTRTTAGTGIGLALVKKLVEAMGGRVRAANNPDAGCTITLSLPLDGSTEARP